MVIRNSTSLNRTIFAMKQRLFSKNVFYITHQVVVSYMSLKGRVRVPHITYMGVGVGVGVGGWTHIHYFGDDCDTVALLCMLYTCILAPLSQ